MSSTYFRFRSRLISIRRYLPILVILGLMTLFFVTGIIGINFGQGWDDEYHYETVKCSLKSRILLPCIDNPEFEFARSQDKAFYDYPSFCYLLSLISYVLGDAFQHIFLNSHTYLSIESFRLIVRPAFLALSCCSGLWLYLSLSKTSKIAAIIATVIQLLSWEFAYHSRWIAPDAVMAQFCALWLMALARSENSVYRLRWLAFAAIAAGLATATKYTAGALLPATIFFLWFTKSQTLKIRNFPVKTAITLLILFLITFIIITPGAILQPLEFIKDVRYVMHHYSSTHTIDFGVATYDIHDGALVFAARLWEYISFALISHIPLLSFLLMLTSLVGLTHLFRTKRQVLAITIAGIILFYTYYFSSNTVVFIVRNYLFLLPLIAFLIGNGIERMLNHSRLARFLALVLLITTITLHSYNLIDSALSISDSKRNDLTFLIDQYIKSHSNEKFALSKSLQNALKSEKLPNVVKPTEADTFAYSAFELLVLYETIKLNDYPSTRHNTFKWLGSRELNLNYYAVWEARDKILLVPMKDADRMGLTSVLTENSLPVKNSGT
ncbi:glycosyltransferase family 39 protein [Nostoc sp. ChiQUE01b]|uniref:glycosyltransferase family 39 protein n=1 Tax=Nostoc sp. ChiQUE01b TaxID=3075376 RepID=UPI002AD56025|nr:glycosyltransferase family 39 protein [Nostoc sp. ChiQUE01b]MDZ8257304.1 glycosyltransferase family 39 protein [Nostoc sp. ChiQUE01b]